MRSARGHVADSAMDEYTSSTCYQVHPVFNTLSKRTHVCVHHHLTLIMLNSMHIITKYHHKENKIHVCIVRLTSYNIKIMSSLFLIIRIFFLIFPNN